MVNSRVVVGGNIRIHVYLQLPYTVYSRVVVGAIYAYMCTYSYRTRWTHVWWWGQYMHTCVPTATVHGVPYTVNSRVVVGTIYAYMCTYSYRTQCTHVWWWGQYTHTCVPTATVHGAPYTGHRTWCTIHGELTCGGGIHMWELLTCAGDIHVWELLTCETSHRSEILHSLIFFKFVNLGDILWFLITVSNLINLIQNISAERFYTPKARSTEFLKSEKKAFN